MDATTFAAVSGLVTALTQAAKGWGWLDIRGLRPLAAVVLGIAGAFLVVGADGELDALTFQVVADTTLVGIEAGLAAIGLYEGGYAIGGGLSGIKKAMRRPTSPPGSTIPPAP